MFTCPIDINGHRFPDLPMVMVNIQGQDIILGHKWFSKYNILLDCLERQLIWPDEQKDYVGTYEWVVP